MACPEISNEGGISKFSKNYKNMDFPAKNMGTMPKFIGEDRFYFPNSMVGESRHP